MDEQLDRAGLFARKGMLPDVAIRPMFGTADLLQDVMRQSDRL